MPKTEKKVLKNVPETPTEPSEDAPIIDPPAPEPEEERKTDAETAQPTDQPPPSAGTEPPAKKTGKGYKLTDEEANARPNILQRLALLENWEDTYVYLYRTRPFTNKLLNGQRHVHVKRWDTLVDEEDILQEAGSGAYLIQVTRRDPKTGIRRMFDSGEIRVLNMNHPPKIPTGEWVDDPRNKEWEWARAIIFKVKDEEKAPPAPPPPDPLIEILRDELKASRDELKDIRQEMNKPKPDPNAGLVTLIAPFIPAIVAKITAPAPTPADPFTQVAAVLKVVNEIRPATAESKDASSELERLLKVQKTLDEQYGGRSNGGGEQRSRKTGLQELIADCAPHVSQMLTPVFQMVAMGMQQRGGMQGGMMQTGQPMPESAGLIPAAPQENNGWSNNGAPPEQPQQKPGPQLVKPPTIEALAQRFLSALQKDEDGFSVGDWYLETYGENEFIEARAQGKFRIIQDLQSVPNVWRFLAVYLEDKKLDRIITEFVTWTPGDGDDDDEDEEDETPPIDAAPEQTITTGWTQQPEMQEAH